jgi:hypothetical protein
MGRFKHEAATVRVTQNGTVAACMGDDECFDYRYKFVSSRPMSIGRGSWPTIWESLMRARFTSPGSPVTHPGRSTVPGGCPPTASSTGRTVDPAGPLECRWQRGVLRSGHVLELTEDGDDPAATTFRWTLLGTWLAYVAPTAPLSRRTARHR